MVWSSTHVAGRGARNSCPLASIGKIASYYQQAGKSILLAAGDTFRAAAKEQLAVWANRNTVDIVSQEGADPGAVCFDAITAGRARGRRR